MIPNKLYHIYNRGNNRQEVFFSEPNYLYFINKLHALNKHGAALLAYCLMPNHFHLLVATEDYFDERTFKNTYRTLLSSYTRDVSKQLDRIGSLFQQNSHFKEIREPIDKNGFLVLMYIHQNPLWAKLVNNLKDWPFSSYPDYAGVRNGVLPNKTMARERLDLPEEGHDFEGISLEVMPDVFVDAASADGD